MRFLRRGLMRKLLAYSLLLSLVPLAIVGYLAYHNGRQALQKQVADHLTSVAILKEAEINSWIGKEQEEIELLASLAVIRENLIPLLSQDKPGRDYGAAYENIANYLKTIEEKERDFLELFLLSADEGKVLVSTDRKQEGKYKEDRPYFVGGRKGVYVQNVYHSLTLGAPAMTIAAPIKDESGQVISVLVGRVNPEGLSEIMGERSGLGETGETYLVNKYNYFVTESRFEPGYPFRHGIYTLGVEEALRGNNGTGLYEDYRGMPVIGAYRWMEDRELALLAEMDQAEAFAPIRRMRDVMLVIAAVLALAVLFAGLISTRAITVPILKLVSAAEAIGRGELEQRVKVRTQDEIGRLADVFNQMALDLRRSRAEVVEYSRYLEGKVAERTRELEEANKDLEETRDALLYMLEDINEVNAELQQAKAQLEEYGQTLEDKVEERTKELSALNAIAATVSESLDLEEILDAALDKVLELMGVEAGEVFLVEEESRDLVLARHRGLFPDSFREITRFKPGEGFLGRVAQSGQLLVTTDLAGDLRFLHPGVIEAGFGSFACIPLKAKDKVVGTLDVAAVGRRPFSAEDIALLTGIGHQIGVAIENAQLFEETKEAYAGLEERNRRLRRLYELAVTMAGDVTRVADQVVSIIAEVLDIKVALVERLEDETIRAIAMYDHGQLLHEGEFPLLGTPCERVQVERQVCIYNQVAKCFPEDPFLQEKGLVAYVGLPVLDSRGEVIAVVNAMDDRPREFSAEDLELLHTLAQRVGLELERAEAEAEVRRRAGELAALGEVHRAITSTLNLDEMLTILLENVVQVSHADTATVMLIRPDGDELETIAGRGTEEQQEATLQLKVGEGAAGWVAREGVPLAITDVQSDPRFIHKDLAAKAGTVSYLGVPLKAKGKVIGVLNLSTRHPYEFAPEEVDFLATLGGEAAMAIENAHLYGQIEERARELSRDLLEQKQYAENVLRSTADGVYSTDRERRVLSWSQGAEAITGLRAAEVLGRPCQEFLRHTDEAGRVLCDTPECPLTTVMTSGQPIPTRQVYAHAVEGPLVPVAVTAAPIFDEQGQVVGAVEVFRDVSKERQLMESIQRANRAKSEFLAAMSHELRTPLNSIIGFSEVLQDQAFGPLNEKQTRYVGNILVSGQHLLQLINDVLDLSKVEAGKMELVYSEVSLPQALEGAVGMFRTAAAKKNLSLELDVAPEVDILVADPVRLKQILYNLLSNAVKFTPENGKITVVAKELKELRELRELPSVPFDYAQDKPSVPLVPLVPLVPSFVVSVSDTGIGIAEEDMPRIWREFEQVESPYTRQHGGTGLGLPLTKRLVELHGGRIWTESAVPGKGSTFTFVLPQRPPLEARHAVVVYSDVGELIPLVVRGFVDALGRGYKAVYIGPVGHEAARGRELDRRGVEVSALTAGGQLGFVADRSLLLQEGQCVVNVRSVSRLGYVLHSGRMPERTRGRAVGAIGSEER